MEKGKEADSLAQGHPAASGKGTASHPISLHAPELHVLTTAHSLPCILGAYKGQGRTLNGSRGGRHIRGYPQVWQLPAAGKKSDSSSWKSSLPLLQTSFVIQANSRSCCAFLVRNFGETIGKKKEMGNSHDSQLTCQKTQSTIQAILHLYSG